MFDYVIVGGGSAGCVVAARLAEDPGTRVLLLEAGPDASAIEEVRVPAAYSRLFRSQYDWNYVTLPQERADVRPIYWPRGKVLGGSSAIGAMIYIRGHRDDYDSWRSTYGCTGWGYKDLFPYFRRAEDNSRAREPVPRRRAARCRSRTCGTSPSTPSSSSRRPCGAARWPTTTSTGRSRRASASTR